MGHGADPAFAGRVLFLPTILLVMRVYDRYEVIYTPSDIFVVMEYVPNGELFDYIVTKRKVSRVCDLAGSLHSAHPCEQTPQAAQRRRLQPPPHYSALVNAVFMGVCAVALLAAGVTRWAAC